MRTYRFRSTVLAASAFFIPGILFFTVTCSLAANVTLKWDANDPEPEGYRVFVREDGASYNYSAPLWEDNLTECTLIGLTDGTTYHFVVRAYDGALESADSEEVYYTPPTGSDDAPVAADDSYSVKEGGTLNISAAGGVLANDTDPDGDTLSATLAGGAANGTLKLNANGSFTYVHNGGETISDSFTYSISDGHGNTDAARATITVTPVNDAPTANAGKDRSVAEGLAVTLDGSGSTDPDSSILSFLWVQTAGPAVSLSSPNAVRPTLTAPQVGSDGATLQFRLTVSDGAGVSGSDVCRITVTDIPDDNASTSDTDNDGFPDSVDDDDDDDGMPDDWENAFGLNATIADADADLDNDGISNRDEYRAGLEPDEAGTGTAPRRPTLVSPTSYSQVACNPVLAANDYADSDGDAHIATQWQIYDTGSGDCLLDVITDLRLTRLTVPVLLLTGNHTYHWRLRFFDSGGRASAWSALGYFITEAAADDANGNGIPDDQEGQSISHDGSYASLAAGPAACEPTGISVADDDTVSTIEQMVVLDPAAFKTDETTPPDLPSSMVAYRLILNAPGQRARITIHLSDPAPAGSSWVKYDAVNGWQDFTQQADFSGDRLSVTIEIKDGETGDADGAVNGIIVDPSGLSVSDDGTAASTSSGSGGGGCFITGLHNPPDGAWVDPPTIWRRSQLFFRRCWQALQGYAPTAW